MGESRVSNPLVDQFRRGGVPKDLRLIAAQGALPLKLVDLLELLEHLLQDSDPDVHAAAKTTFAAFPVPELLPLMKDRDTPPSVLHWCLTGRTERDLRESVLQNTSTMDESIETVAATLQEELAELVVINQMRLLRRTSLLEALETNPSLNNDQRRRLRELRETFRIGEAAPVAVAPPPPAPGPPPEPEPAAPLPEDVALTEDEALVRYLAEDERGESEKVSAVQRLYRLNTAEKVITALKGNREERAILVRDPNRIVATAVLGSPRLTEAEIESFAGMKSVSDEILRQIGSHKEWTKRYGVIASLVRNPRCPLAITLGMVPRLNPKDLKSISVDRNVPEVIRKHAQRFVRGPAGGPGGPKK